MADSYNQLFGLGSHSEDSSLEGWWKLQDNAASTVVDDGSSNNLDGSLQGGDNTSDISTTGPTAWLSRSLNFDGSSDYITTSAGVTGANFTALVWGKYDTVTGTEQPMFGQGASSSTAGKLLQLSCETGGTAHSLFYRHGVGNIRYSMPSDATNWHHYAIVGEGGPNTDDVSVYIDGTLESGTRNAGSNQTLNVSSSNPFCLGAGHDATYLFDGQLAESAIFSRNLTSDEIDEVYSGPEPLNTIAPAISGTAQEGQTLSATSGTWDSQSNGTITYGYQWTRSDDASGTNEADIAGATSSAYLLLSADVGKYIRCRIRGTNDGGFDKAEDSYTAFSTAVTAASSGGSGPDTVVLRGDLPSVLNDTLDLTSSGFGTPTAAIVFLDSTYSGVNPNTSAASLSVGMFDGTNQRVASIYSQDNVGTTNTSRYMNSGSVASLMGSTGSLVAEYSAAFITDGIRLTMDVDATSVGRFVTVVLFKGVQAKVLTFTPSASDSGTQESASIGFAPKAMCVIGNGDTVGSTSEDHSVLTLGFAGDGDGSRQIMFGSSNGVGTSVACTRMDTSNVCGQLFSNNVNWSAGVTSWGSDTFTMTSSPGNAGGDEVCCLVFDDALTCQLGSLDARNSTGDQTISTPGFDPEAVVIAMTNRSAQNSTGTGGTNNEGICFGAGDTNGSFAHGHTEGDNLGTINVKSESSATNIIELYSASSGSTHLYELGASLSSLGTEEFTLNYNRASGTSTRRGWYVAFGAATSSISPTLECEPGSFSLGGVEASALVSRMMTAATGGFSFAGINCSLNYNPLTGYNLVCELGTFSLSCPDLDLLVGRKLTGGVGSFGASGPDAQILAHRSIAADPSTYSLSGLGADARARRRLEALTGSYSLSGVDVTLAWSGQQFAAWITIDGATLQVPLSLASLEVPDGDANILDL